MGLGKTIGKWWNNVVGNNDTHEEIQIGKTLAQAIDEAQGVAINLNNNLNNYTNNLLQIDTKFRDATQQLAQSERNVVYEKNLYSNLTSQISNMQSQVNDKFNENSTYNSQLLTINAELEQKISILSDKNEQKKALEVIQAASNEDVLSDINQLSSMEENLVKLEKVEDELTDQQRLLQTSHDYYEQFCSLKEELEESSIDFYQEQYQIFQDKEQEILGELLKDLEHL